MTNENEVKFTQTGEHLVKTSEKQAGKLRNFFGRILKSTSKVVSYIPGVKFVTEKLNKDTKNENTSIMEGIIGPINMPAPQKEMSKKEEPVQETKTENQTSEQPRPIVEPNFTLSIFDNPKVETPEISEKENAKEIKPKKTLPGKKLFASPKTEEHSKEATSKAEEKPVITPIDLDIHIPDYHQEPKTKTIEKSDNELLEESRDQYGNLIKFANWDEYYDSFSAEEQKEKTGQGTILKTIEFTAFKSDQAKTIKRITQAEEEKRRKQIDQLKQEIETRKNNIKANKGSITKYNKEIARLRNENKQLNEANKTATANVDVLEKDSERAKDKIREMDEIIAPQAPTTTVTEKSQKDNKTNAAKKRVEEILKEEEERIKKQQQMAKVAKAINNLTLNKDKKVSEKEIIPQETKPETHSLADELSDFDNEKHEESQITNWKNNYINNTTDAFVQAEREINNSDMPDETKNQERQELYSQFDDFVNSVPSTTTKHRHR